MSVVAGAAQHSVLAVNLLRKEDAVAVEWQECVLALEELLEVECVSDADGWSVIAVAPCNPVAVFNPCDTRVIFVFRFNHLGVAGLEYYRLVLNLPVYAVLAESCKDVHLYSLVVAAEHSRISILERNDCTVEYAVRCRYGITADNRVL